MNCCEALQIGPDEYAHQETCQYYQKENDADKLRKVLRGVELGMWSDSVLVLHPRSQMIRKPVVLGRDPTPGWEESVVVDWVYPNFTLTMARGETQDAKYGKLVTYAVQKIRGNNEHKRNTRKYRDNRRRKASRNRPGGRPRNR